MAKNIKKNDFKSENNDENDENVLTQNDEINSFDFSDENKN